MKRQIVLLSSMFVLLGCTNQLYISSDFDREADFNSYKTFSWNPDLEIVRNQQPMLDNELNRRRITEAIISQMKLKGLVHTDVGPDLLVDFHITIDDSIEYIIHDYPPARYRYWTNSDLTSYTVKKGALIVHLIDSKTKRLVWQGVASKNLSEVMPEDLEERINQAVKAIFSRYPPTEISNKIK